MNPLIGRTCVVEEFTGIEGEIIASVKHRAIIMDVQPANQMVSAGTLAHVSFNGWKLLVLMEGGALMSFEHTQVTVT